MPKGKNLAYEARDLVRGLLNNAQTSQSHHVFSQGGEDAVKKRDAIARSMTPNQIAEAQKLAREWKPKGK